jgi:hypothetical protein
LSEVLGLSAAAIARLHDAGIAAGPGTGSAALGAN